MNLLRRVKLTSMLALVVVTAVGSACSSSSSTNHAEGEWSRANKKLPGYEKAGNAEAKAVIDKIVASGVPCDEYTPYPFNAVFRAYTAGNMPMARGAGTCYGFGDPAATTGDPEEVLVEIYGKRPSAKDFVIAKAIRICKRAEKLAKGVDAPLFTGIPFVMSKDATWIIEPDTFVMAERIGTALGRPAQNMCDFD